MVSGAASGDPVVRYSRMWCPHDIGRDSWVWGEQGTLWFMNSPHEVGEEAPSERSPLSGDSVPPSWVKMVVVVVVVVLVLVLVVVGVAVAVAVAGAAVVIVVADAVVVVFVVVDVVVVAALL